MFPSFWLSGFGGEPKDLGGFERQDLPVGLSRVGLAAADLLSEWHPLLEPLAPWITEM